MRGKVLEMLGKVLVFRITPAYAGKRKIDGFRRVCLEDHPRLCGEKFCRALPGTGFTGSPPPMRGKATRHIRAIDTVGITPAYAGKSRIYYQFPTWSKDHPRLCGEKGCEIMYLSIYEGSPPPMRGKVTCDLTNFCSLRITPAYAGKSCFL